MEAPWQWSTSEIESRVNHVRGGRALRPSRWPGGARFAVALSFDSDHETNELRDGGASIARLSWGQYGARVGVPRIAAILARHGAPASFFVPAVTALLHPDEQRALAGDGHEIALHGWIHELNTGLPSGIERDLLARAADVLTEATGTRPVGMRTPSWDFAADTLRAAIDLGLSYDSSLMADEDCYELLCDGEPSGLVELPVEWIRDDAAYLLMHRAGSLRPYISPDDVFTIFRRELEAAAAEGGLFQLTMHPHVIGARSRIWILDEIIRLATSLDGWLATHAQVVDHVRADCGLPLPSSRPERNLSCGT